MGADSKEFDPSIMLILTAIDSDGGILTEIEVPKDLSIDMFNKCEIDPNYNDLPCGFPIHQEHVDHILELVEFKIPQCVLENIIQWEVVPQRLHRFSPK